MCCDFTNSSAETLVSSKQSGPPWLRKTSPQAFCSQLRAMSSAKTKVTNINLPSQIIVISADDKTSTNDDYYIIFK